MIKRFSTTLFRFSTQKNMFRFSTQTTKSQNSSSITTAEHNFKETPVYLKPYDKAKYQVPMNKIKKNSGYALLQIEPFPRARIMKIGYKILEQVRIGIPQDYPDRIFLEERTKYIMEITDKITDVEELQDFFGTDSIEQFILGLTRNIEYINLCRKHKFWQMKPSADFEHLQKITSPQSVKYPIYKKGERPNSKFLDA